MCVGGGVGGGGELIDCGAVTTEVMESITGVNTLRALKSLSSECPTRMEFSGRILASCSWTSESLVVTPFKTSAVIPLYLAISRARENKEY